MSNRTHYKFALQTPQGIMQRSIPVGDMKACPCGHDLFQMQFRMAWDSTPALIGEEPMSYQVPVYVCAKCGSEVGPDSPTVDDLNMPKLTLELVR